VAIQITGHTCSIQFFVVFSVARSDVTKSSPWADTDLNGVDHGQLDWDCEMALLFAQFFLVAGHRAVEPVESQDNVLHLGFRLGLFHPAFGQGAENGGRGNRGRT
jgi:hypothetical protein